jgi:hypothetical protein
VWLEKLVLHLEERREFGGLKMVEDVFGSEGGHVG